MNRLPAAPPVPAPAPGERHTFPYPHVEFGPGTLLGADTTARLTATYPAHLLTTATHRSGGSKTYTVNALNLHHRGTTTPELDRLDPVWRAVVDRLTDPGYSRHMLRLLGLPAVPVDIEVRLTEYRRGGWMSRHTDRTDKAFSQNVYLCPGWQPHWGGGLGLYATATAAEPVKTFVPAHGNSLAFARSDASWHEVFPVDARAAAPRRALLLHAYWADGREAPCGS
ncbi:2OG-Fe(II) oxygenase family protein [Streptomyces sp. NPDC050095]|uniref:2OG-Fe(II) oxygenase family protein n=1 Tax=unclassified Streptomyces TaxID=2593676 RepID=UPI00341FB628